MWVREYDCVAKGGGVEIGDGVVGGVEIGVAVGGKCGCRHNVGVDCSLGLDMTMVEFLDFIPIWKNLPYLPFVFKASLSLGVGVGVGIGVGVWVSVGADCSVCFSGEECLAARHQCSDRGVMPFAHWRVSPPPKKWRRGALPVQQCRGDLPSHAGGFFGKRGSVSASQCIASIPMEGQFSLACWRSPQPV